jgi:glycosyltransferase involved in cell wall biosynthesis
MKTIVVFSHLRWNFVYQRPQHLLSRLARRYRVIFIEEPIPGCANEQLEVRSVAPGVEVWLAHLTGSAHGFHDSHFDSMAPMIQTALDQQQVEDYWIWFYTPMAFRLASSLQPCGLVYDCMDELAAFKNAPLQLVQRENAVLESADLVFTGGLSLHRAKRSRHPSVHCFPSSVDAQHFSPGQADHPLQAGLPHPRLGYCGVIDERLDLAMLAGLAAARPAWQIVMVGPVAKIDPTTLPQAPNIHWLGQHSYEDLPSFIAGWDVCLLPFALNDATRYISPTKTLEYMACGKPSVSTPIKDVIDSYGDLVPIATTTDDMLLQCERILQRSPAEQATHARDLAARVARTSWDATAEAMARLIDEADSVQAAESLPENVPWAATAMGTGFSGQAAPVRSDVTKPLKGLQ